MILPTIEMSNDEGRKRFRGAFSPRRLQCPTANAPTNKMT